MMENLTANAAPGAKKKNFLDEIADQYGGLHEAVPGLMARVKDHPVNARIDLQVLLNALGREEESFQMSNELMQIASDDPRVLFNRGWHLLKRGKLQEGLGYLEFGRKLNTYGHPALPSTQGLWTPQRGKGHRVHLVLEGGFGDEIIHFRFGKTLVEKYGCHVTVVCNPKLAKLFAHQPWVSAVMQREAALGVYHDSWLPGMSGALALGMEYQDLPTEPYISADSVHLKKWSSVLPKNTGKLKVGIRWAGSPQFEHQQLRFFSPELLLGLEKYEGIQLYSFQRDDNLRDLPEKIIDLGPHLQTWEDTAAALDKMDLVISSCTSVAHLAAALGKPTWVVTPALPYFIWALPGRTSPWYKDVRLFRQKSYGSWDDTEQLLHKEIQEWLKTSQS